MWLCGLCGWLTVTAYIRKRLMKSCWRVKSLMTQASFNHCVKLMLSMSQAKWRAGPLSIWRLWLEYNLPHSPYISAILLCRFFPVQSSKWLAADYFIVFIFNSKTYLMMPLCAHFCWGSLRERSLQYCTCIIRKCIKCLIATRLILLLSFSYYKCFLCRHFAEGF